MGKKEQPSLHCGRERGGRGEITNWRTGKECKERMGQGKGFKWMMWRKRHEKKKKKE